MVSRARLFIRLGGASALALVASSALAQDAEETIVVTGSHIPRADDMPPSPLLTIDADALQSSGTTNITDALTDYPALVASSTSNDNAGESAPLGNAGLNLLNLRGLGTQRTLVLVDGRRHVSGLPGQQAVDINTIPSDLIERVEILTGGASAVYGADGVTGVVNFVMKRDFEGLTARGQAGISEYGDAGQRLASVTGGTNFAGGRGNFALSYEYSAEDRLRSRDRARLSGSEYLRFTRNPADADLFDGGNDGVPDFIPLRDVRFGNSARAGAIDVNFDTIPDFLGNGDPFDPGTPLPLGYQQGGSGTLTSDFGTDILPRIRRHVANAFVHFDASDAVTLFGEAKYASTRSFTEDQPTYDYLLFIWEDNPYIPAAVRPAIIPGGGGFFLNRDNFDLGARGQDLERETVRAVAGAHGEIAPGIGFELAYTFGRTDISTRYLGDMFDDRFYAAIDVVTDPGTGNPTCRVNLDPSWTPFQPYVSFYSDPPLRDVLAPTTFQPGECVPLNLFGEGVASQEAIDFISADTRDKARLEQHVLSGALTGTLDGLALPGGAPAFAVGAEYRKEKSRFTADALAQQGLTFTNTGVSNRGSFDAKEAFAELRLPLLADRPFAERLEISGAVRAADYSTVGSSFSWKLEGSWAPVRDFALNGSLSRAVRAPNITELFAGAATTFAAINDPCSFFEVGNGSATRAANCADLLTGLGVADPSSFFDPRTSGVAGTQSGNDELDEEKATTWTAGFSFAPRFAPGISLRADWYDIEIRDAISYVDPGRAAALCVDAPSLDNAFCDLVDRVDGGPAAGLIGGFTIIPQNVSRYSTAGLDVQLGYRLDAGSAGRFEVRVVANYLDELQSVNLPGDDPVEARGTANAPKYQANMDLTWKKGPMQLSYGLSWFDKTLRYDRDTIAANPDIVAPEYLRVKERWVSDIQASVEAGERFEFYAGVNNLFGQRPAIGLASYPVSAVGRFFYAGARVKLPSF